MRSALSSGSAAALGIYVALPPGLAPDPDHLEWLIRDAPDLSEEERETCACRLYDLIDEDLNTGRRLFAGEKRLAG